jgi:hypothetical protein
VRLLVQLATASGVDAEVRERARATALLIILAQLLAAGGGERPVRGRFSLPASWRAPRRARPPYATTLTGRRPRG